MMSVYRAIPKSQFASPRFYLQFCAKDRDYDRFNERSEKEYAGLLYLRESLTQQEIAEKVGVSRRTVGTWITTGKWEEMKAGFTMTREQQIANLQRQIAEINNVIAQRPSGERFASAAESKTIAQLSAAIDKLEKDAGLKDLISSATRFLVWLRSIDIGKAKEFGVLWDNFIRSTL